jgi:hypothetical protein
LQKLCVRAIAPVDAEYSARRAMSRITAPTQIALAATRIDLTNNATTNEFAIARVFYESDEFVTDGSVKACIATSNLEIGVANAREQHADECLTGLIGLQNILDCQTFFFDAKREHSHKKAHKHKMYKPLLGIFVLVCFFVAQKVLLLV